MPYGILTHELLHAVLHLMRARDIPVNEDTEEVLTYMVQHLYNRVVGKISKKK